MGKLPMKMYGKECRALLVDVMNGLPLVEALAKVNRTLEDLQWNLQRKNGFKRRFRAILGLRLANNFLKKADEGTKVSTSMLDVIMGLLEGTKFTYDMTKEGEEEDDDDEEEPEQTKLSSLIQEVTSEKHDVAAPDIPKVPVGGDIHSGRSGNDPA